MLKERESMADELCWLDGCVKLIGQRDVQIGMTTILIAGETTVEENVTRYGCLQIIAAQEETVKRLW